MTYIVVKSLFWSKLFIYFYHFLDFTPHYFFLRFYPLYFKHARPREAFQKIYVIINLLYLLSILLCFSNNGFTLRSNIYMPLMEFDILNKLL